MKSVWEPAARGGRGGGARVFSLSFNVFCNAINHINRD